MESKNSIIEDKYTIKEAKLLAYTFKVKLNHRKKIYREFIISGSSDLVSLASVIVENFNFDFDHAYGFYSNLKNNYRSEEKYELFADNPIEFDTDDDTRGVSDVLIANVFEPKKKMLFLFDYGDNWEFEIECKKVEDKIVKESFILIKSNGIAPEQYPDYDQEEE